MTDPTPLLQAAFEGCAASVGPLIGLELSVGESSVETSDRPPDGELAVLPFEVGVDDAPLGTFTLSVPLQELAVLGRRMLGADDPDKEAELDPDGLDACGKVLSLMGGAVDGAVREHLNDAIECKPGAWWRTDDAGGEGFPEGECVLATAAIDVPDGRPVNLTLRIASGLLESGAEATSSRVKSRALLIGLGDEASGVLRPVLDRAHFAHDTAEVASFDVHGDVDSYHLIVVSGDVPEAYGLVRSIRLGDKTWTIPCIVCVSEPTRDAVVRFVEEGATHVLRMPAEESDVARVVQAARG